GLWYLVNNTETDQKLKIRVMNISKTELADTLARALSVSLAQALRQPVVVENKPGASTVIGADYVAKSQPDGYTLLVTSAPHVSNPSLMKKLPFDTVKDFAPVCLAAQSPFVLVVKPDSPIK
ncbi:MAG: tripartite tricarboxylate transporter substrate-binding protein, partial [Pollutimonas bauzanensis]